MSLLLLLHRTAAGVDLTVPAGQVTLTPVVPTLRIANDIDLTVVAGQVTLTGVVPTVETTSITVVAGEVTLTGTVPTLFLNAGVDMTVVAPQVTVTGTVPTLVIADTIDLTVVAGEITLTGTVPDLDTEGIIWVSATATAPTELPAVLFGFWLTDTIVLRLYGAGLSYDQDTDTYASDLNDELPTAGGYTAGGITLTGKSLETISATNRTRLLSDPVEIATATFDVAFAALIWDVGADSASPILGVFDFGGLRSVTGELFHVEPSDEGWGIGISA